MIGQRSSSYPKPPADSHELNDRPAAALTVTVAILAQGTSWPAALAQANSVVFKEPRL